MATCVDTHLLNPFDGWQVVVFFFHSLHLFISLHSSGGGLEGQDCGRRTVAWSCEAFR